MNGRKIIQRLVAVGLSVGLLAFLVASISLERLRHAASELDWQLLVPATVVMVLLLYLWDAACLPTVYQVQGYRWSYWKSLHLRGLSYLGGAINYELGQGVLAWGAARLQNTGIVRMLARTVVLAYHDLVVLLSMGLAGAVLSDQPRIVQIRPMIAIGLGIALALAVFFWLLPHVIGPKIRSKRVDLLFEGWSLRRSLQLMPQRMVYFGILVVYAAVALRICRVPVDYRVIASSIPLVLLVEGLPSFAGFGTRDASLQLLLKPEDPAVLLALSLIWSTGMLVVRTMIGVAHLWFGPALFVSFAQIDAEVAQSKTP
jgi:hypothetical protein